jgi:hypothetical protein
MWRELISQFESEAELSAPAAAEEIGAVERARADRMRSEVQSPIN